jgi:hypothetical protein
MDSELERIAEQVPSDGAIVDGVIAEGVAFLPPRPLSTTPSDGSVGSRGSRGSRGSKGSIGSIGSNGKRRTWKKPKDKPKRPLSAYNLFFKHERSRIVEGMLDEATPQDIINSVEGILATSRETRRHRKTHGRISFGDLARKIAEQWKCIQPEQKAVFDHYAEIDMRRYRKEVKIWKDKKENEALALSDHNPNGKMNGSISSVGSESEFSLDHFASASSGGDAWGPRKANLSDSMNSSFSSTGSNNSQFSLEPLPIGIMSGSNSGSNQMMGGLNPQPQFNSSMPTTISTGQPGGIGGDGGGGGMGGFDNSLSLSYAQQLQLQNLQLQQQHAQQFQQFQQQQQQILAFQQNSTPMHNQHQQHPQMDPVPFEQVFPDEHVGGGSSSQDLEDFLSNLDLSNI